MTQANEADLLSRVKRFFVAYNDMDMQTLRELLTDDVHWEHHNRFKGSGAVPLLQSIRDIQAKQPDRRFGDVTRWAVNGDTVYAEHGWTGTPAESDETKGWQAGVPRSMDCVSVLVLTGGRIREWSDYG